MRPPSIRWAVSPIALCLGLALLAVGCGDRQPTQFVQNDHPAGYFTLADTPNWSRPLMMTEPAGLYLNVCRLEYQPGGQSRGGMVMLRLGNAQGHLDLAAAAEKYQALQEHQKQVIDATTETIVAGYPAIRFDRKVALAQGETKELFLGRHYIIAVGQHLYTIDIICSDAHADTLDSDIAALFANLQFTETAEPEVTTDTAAAPH